MNGLLVDERTDYAEVLTTMSLLQMSAREGRCYRGMSMFTSKETGNRERDQQGSMSGRVSFGRVAPSLLQTSTPIACDGTNDQKHSGTLCSGMT